MTASGFWGLVGACRLRAADMPSFNAALERVLAGLPADELWSFYRWGWHYARRLQWHSGMKFNAALHDCLDQAMGLHLGGDTGDCYAGWVIAQGKDFYDRLLGEPERAADRLPMWDEVWEGENVIFLA